MKLHNTLSLLLMTTLASTSAFALNAERAPTASGHAYAEPYKAVRKEGVLHIEVRFVTDYPGYSGEIIYDDIPLARISHSAPTTFADQAW
ncbi:hypothetical protein [Halomonas sp.]|uniref:hypothetical protein n=1 Tax=Halomonas sp. TaxID=1486246 RepID=UPI003F92F334